ncbi:MAG: response regulator [Candidatus Obscuribacterales bacterium]|nr:response regulator [Steroidobacteraceae bacterium]
MSSGIQTILASELHQLGSELSALTPELGAGSEAAAEQSFALCERVGQLAELLQTPALQELAVFLIGNVAATLGVGDNAKSVGPVCLALEQCLLDDSGSSRWTALAGEFTNVDWPVPLTNDIATATIESFRNLSIDLGTPQPQTPPVLTDADLTLAPAEDANRETLQAYFTEAPQQAAELSALLTNFDTANAPDAIATAQRLVHTIKGSSSLVGLHAIAHLAHALETAMLQALAGPALAPGNLSGVISQAADMIESLIEQASSGGSAPHDLLELINALYAPASDAPASQVGYGPTSAVGNDTSDADKDAPEETSRGSADTVVPAAASFAATLNVPVAVIDDNLRRTGELNTAIGQLMTQVAETLRRAEHLGNQLSRVQGQVYELETLVDTRGVPAIRQDIRDKLVDGFDPLELDEYTALHSLSRAFSESTLDSRELSRELAEELLKLQNLLAQHARLGRELNDSVTGARLVPVATIAPRLERIVRQTARQTNRNVELTIVGRELSIDTDILNGLVEPLMHALRNAVDHGIEAADERMRLGKTPHGNVQLEFRREGNRIEVKLRDDGRGLDFKTIAQRARERGLLADSSVANERDLTQLIFTPGFTTRSEATAVSGRGVGMDVVRASIERLKGTVHLESLTGVGCTLLLRLPLSLTSQHTLFVGIDDCIYGLPSTAVEQVLYSDAGRIVELGDRFGFEYGDQISPLYSLGALLGHSEAPMRDLASTPRPVVLVHGDEGLVALTVDRALDSRQTVIKGLSPLLPNMPGVAGAAVLPSGGIGIILELRELLRKPQPRHVATPVMQAEVLSKTSRRALVVDDSLSARRGLAQLLGDAGYAVATAIDGIDALSQMESKPPDVVLVDMEMPRMNGLELTAHLRGNAAWREVPIVMITSRAADKHRTQALRTGVNEYVTKPYLEHDLIDRLYALAPP